MTFRFFFFLVSAFLISLCVPPLAYADEGKPSTMISLLYGEMSLSSDYWAPVEKQSTYGVMFDYNPGGWPVSIMGGLSLSNKSASGLYYIPGYGNYALTIDGKTTELSLGARKYFMDAGAVRPYLSAGLSNVSAEVSGKASGVSVSDSSSSIGYFGNGGIIVVMDRFSVGFDFKILTGTSMKLFSVSGDANYNRWGLVVGMAF